MLVGGTHTHSRRTAPVAASHAAPPPPLRRHHAQRGAGRLVGPRLNVGGAGDGGGGVRDVAPRLTPKPVAQRVAVGHGGRVATLQATRRVTGGGAGGAGVCGNHDRVGGERGEVVGRARVRGRPAREKQKWAGSMYSFSWDVTMEVGRHLPAQ